MYLSIIPGEEKIEKKKKKKELCWDYQSDSGQGCLGKMTQTLAKVTAPPYFVGEFSWKSGRVLLIPGSWIGSEKKKKWRGLCLSRTFSSQCRAMGEKRMKASSQHCVFTAIFKANLKDGSCWRSPKTKIVPADALWLYLKCRMEENFQWLQDWTLPTTSSPGCSFHSQEGLRELSCTRASSAIGEMPHRAFLEPLCPAGSMWHLRGRDKHTRCFLASLPSFFARCHPRVTSAALAGTSLQRHSFPWIL